MQLEEGTARKLDYVGGGHGRSLTGDLGGKTKFMEYRRRQLQNVMAEEVHAAACKKKREERGEAAGVAVKATVLQEGTSVPLVVMWTAKVREYPLCTHYTTEISQRTAQHFVAAASQETIRQS